MFVDKKLENILPGAIFHNETKGNSQEKDSSAEMRESSQKFMLKSEKLLLLSLSAKAQEMRKEKMHFRQTRVASSPTSVPSLLSFELKRLILEE